VADDRALGERERILNRIDVRQALRSLSPTERQLIALRYQQGYSHPQIAARLDIPEATVRVRLHRVQKRLRPLLEDG
jgi:RNA polymerase sigma-70 factor, ECF subfamily